MADDEKRHPVIVDTDALIAVANTGLWPRVTQQEILKVFDYEDDPVLSASEVADGLRRFGKQMTSEGVRNRLGAMAEAGLVSRKKLGARAVGWWAEVAPELDPETAETGDARKESDEWSQP